MLGPSLRAVTIAHLGNIAMQLDRELRRAPDAKDFVGDPQANAPLRRRQRSPGTMENIDKWI
jgi:hypothetical protein